MLLFQFVGERFRSERCNIIRKYDCHSTGCRNVLTWLAVHRVAQRLERMNIPLNRLIAKRRSDKISSISLTVNMRK